MRGRRYPYGEAGFLHSVALNLGDGATLAGMTSQCTVFVGRYVRLGSGRGLVRAIPVGVEGLPARGARITDKTKVTVVTYASQVARLPARERKTLAKLVADQG